MKSIFCFFTDFFSAASFSKPEVLTIIWKFLVFFPKRSLWAIQKQILYKKCISNKFLVEILYFMYSRQLWLF
jgi:hypothetical protein